MQSDPQPSPENDPPSPPEPTWRRRLLGVIYYIALCALPMALGGWVHLAWFETPGPDPAADAVSRFLAAGFLVLVLVVAVPAGIGLASVQPKRLVFGSIWCLVLIAVVLSLGEVILRFSTPPWPALGLHGVPEEVARTAWAPNEADALNGWGQRDRDRSKQKPQGMFRIAMIGDSFLEESASVPIALRVEQKLARPDVEVLNLGVSATDPDEYYYRLRNIALPLEADHCMVFVYAGNDFSAPPRTLETMGGIAAVFPRGSLLSSLGLAGWNHAFTNRRRPVLQAWFAAGDLHRAETGLGQRISNANDQDLRNLLYSLDHSSRPPFQRQTLARRLNSPEILPFFEVLRNPDEGLFRSYYLQAGLWSASVGGGQWAELSEQPAWHWVVQAYNLCRARGVGFTLVVIPEAFQVDARMIEQWRPLTDMQTLTATCRTTATRLTVRAREHGIPAIDLHEAFDGVPGTYLNLDGHWSEKGVELAADVVSKWIDQFVFSEHR